MARIIVFGAMKGGVGKTVSTFNLAYSLVKAGKKVLAEILDPLRSQYDYILIDTSPSLGALTVNALAALMK